MQTMSLFCHKYLRQLLYILDEQTSLVAHLPPTRKSYFLCPLFLSASALRSGEALTALPDFTTLVVWPGLLGDP